MPAFYSQRPTASQGPITPPDSGSGHAYSAMHYPQDSYAQHHSLGQYRHDNSYEYQQAYMQPAVAPAPPAAYSYQHQSASYHAANSLPPIQQSYYEPMGAPILPPLRIDEPLSFSDGYQQQLQHDQQSAAAREHQRQAVKEEKATGGVSAKLDYDMEHMTEFVTQATQSIFRHSMTSPPSFRKWVHQVLSATRLPSATILLSMHYLNNRVANFPESIATGENQIYRLLAVALILGSKFLDDNTFINRSWSDVTAIKVTELNQLEMKWLALIGYHLHVDPTESNGVQAWLEAWREYAEKEAAKQQSTRLSPLDTGVYRQSLHRDRYSPYPSPYSATAERNYNGPHSSRSSQYTDVPYSTDPWLTERQPFDDFFKRQQRYPTLTEIDDLNRRLSDERARQSSFAYAQPAQPSYYQPPAYTPTWDTQSWGGAHRYDCNCSTCAYQHHFRPYSMASSYSAQTVMG